MRLINGARRGLQFVLHHGLEFVEAVPHTLECWRVDGIFKLTIVVVIRCMREKQISNFFVLFLKAFYLLLTCSALPGLLNLCAHERDNT